MELSWRAAKALSSNAFRRLCRTDYLNYLRVREWQDIYTQLRQVVKELGIPVNSEPADYREIHIALLTGLLSHIGMKDADKQEYTGARNARFSIFPVLVYSKAAEMGNGGGTGRNQPPVGRIAARIDPEWVEPVAQHLIKRTYSEPHWERAQGAVMATEKSLFMVCRLLPRARSTTARSIRRYVVNSLFATRWWKVTGRRVTHSSAKT